MLMHTTIFSIDMVHSVVNVRYIESTIGGTRSKNLILQLICSSFRLTYKLQENRHHKLDYDQNQVYFLWCRMTSKIFLVTNICFFLGTNCLWVPLLIIIIVSIFLVEIMTLSYTETILPFI